MLLTIKIILHFQPVFVLPENDPWKATLPLARTSLCYHTFFDIEAKLLQKLFIKIN